MTATAVKERPILFSAPMVRALRDGSKTQTRRVVKPQPPHNAYSCAFDADSGKWAWYDSRDNIIQNCPLLTCPYGVPGDRLWVRETFWNGVNAMQLPCGEYESYYTNYIEYAEQRDSEGWRDGDQYKDWMVKRPSIHMPRWASRITLEVVRVRVERVQEITRKNAIAEGCPHCEICAASPWHRGTLDDALSNAAGGRPFYACDGICEGLCERDWFARLWDSINAKRGHPWAGNPWVWVVEFKVIGGDA